jgi:hypothetical protein
MAVSYEDGKGESGLLKITVDKVLSTSHVEPCGESFWVLCIAQFQKC